VRVIFDAEILERRVDAGGRRDLGDEAEREQCRYEEPGPHACILHLPSSFTYVNASTISSRNRSLDGYLRLRSGKPLESGAGSSSLGAALGGRGWSGGNDRRRSREGSRIARKYDAVDDEPAARGSLATRGSLRSQGSRREGFSVLVLDEGEEAHADQRKQDEQSYRMPVHVRSLLFSAAVAVG
jgi:hypothetical protein